MGRIVDASSSAQLNDWRDAMGGLLRRFYAARFTDIHRPRGLAAGLGRLMAR